MPVDWSTTHPLRPTSGQCLRPQSWHPRRSAWRPRGLGWHIRRRRQRHCHRCCDGVQGLCARGRNPRRPWNTGRGGYGQLALSDRCGAPEKPRTASAAPAPTSRQRTEAGARTQASGSVGGRGGGNTVGRVDFATEVELWRASALPAATSSRSGLRRACRLKRALRVVARIGPQGAVHLRRASWRQPAPKSASKASDTRPQFSLREPSRPLAKSTQNLDLLLRPGVPPAERAAGRMPVPSPNGANAPVPQRRRRSGTVHAFTADPTATIQVDPLLVRLPTHASHLADVRSVSATPGSASTIRFRWSRWRPPIGESAPSFPKWRLRRAQGLQ